MYADRPTPAILRSKVTSNGLSIIQIPRRMSGRFVGASPITWASTRFSLTAAPLSTLVLLNRFDLFSLGLFKHQILERNPAKGKPHTHPNQLDPRFGEPFPSKNILNICCQDGEAENKNDRADHSLKPDAPMRHTSLFSSVPTCSSPILEIQVPVEQSDPCCPNKTYAHAPDPYVKTPPQLFYKTEPSSQI